MSNSNKHIEEFLDYYLNKEQSPDYAVLITGCWGSGKTYFIRKYLEGKGAAGKDVVKTFDWLTDCEKYAVVYVSLFGAKSREEMDKRVLEKLHPILNSEYLKSIPTAVSTIAKLLKEYSVNPALKATGAVAEIATPFLAEVLPNIIKSEGEKFKGAVVVFDDVERADVPLPELLGYLNEYVEHLHVPCILLADKDKWEEAQKCQEDKSTLHHLSSTKEKVIGKEFQIQTDCQNVVNAWLSPEIGYLDIDDNVKKAWWENRDCIYEMFSAFDNAKIKYSKVEVDLSLQQNEQNEYDQEQMREYVLKMPNRNYRALKQTIKDFNHLCCHFAPNLGNLILSSKSKDLGYLKYFLRYFLIMKYGASIGILDANTIGESRPAWTGLKLQNHEFPAKKDSLSNWHCFVKVCCSFYTVDEFPMREWLILNYFDREKAFNEINSSSWFAGRLEYLIGLMCDSWWSLSDEQATECYIAIRDALNCDGSDNKINIKSPTLLMKLFAILSLVTKKASVDINTNQLMNRYLDNNSDAIEFGKIISVDSIMQSYSLEEDDKAFLKDFRNRLLSIFKKRANSFVNDELKFYKDFTSKEMECFNRACNTIQYISNEETGFQWNMVDVEQFLDGFCLIDRYKRSEIIKIMGYRYMNVPGGYDMEKEKVFLSNLKNACISRINQKHEVPLPSVFAMKQMVEKIDEIENIKGLFGKEEKN